MSYCIWLHLLEKAIRGYYLETGGSSRGCCLEMRGNCKCKGWNTPACAGRPEALMFPRSFRAAVFFFLHLMYFLIQFSGSGHLKIIQKFFSEKQYSSNLWLLFDYSNEPSLLKKFCLILSRCIEKIPSGESLSPQNPSPDLLLSRRCWGSVVWTLRGSHYGGEDTGQALCDRSVILRFGLQECWDVLAGVGCLQVQGVHHVIR